MPTHMRINKYLADAGLGSRRACDALVAAGRVTINGKTARPGDAVPYGARVTCDGRTIRPLPTQVWALNKPAGYLCSRIAQGRFKTIYELLPSELHHLDYVGRLDAESEGLLILTNDGILAQKLTRPSEKIPKEYLVQLDKPFDFEKHTPRLLRGMRIEERTARFDKILAAGERTIRVVLTQGIKRQIRVLLGYLGYDVKRLIRTRIGGISLDDFRPALRPGHLRQLGADAIAALTRTVILLLTLALGSCSPEQPNRSQHQDPNTTNHSANITSPPQPPTPAPSLRFELAELTHPMLQRTDHGYYILWQGRPMISLGVNVVIPKDGAPRNPSLAYDGLTRHSGDLERWRLFTLQRLEHWGFNTIGAWSSELLSDEHWPSTEVLWLGSWGAHLDITLPETLAPSKAVRIRLMAPRGLRFQIFLSEYGSGPPGQQTYTGKLGADGEAFESLPFTANGTWQEILLPLEHLGLRQHWGNQRGDKTLVPSALERLSLYIAPQQPPGELVIAEVEFMP